MLGNAAVDRMMEPGGARFIPGASATSHSYTFVGNQRGTDC
jgi:hypothetical protein